MSQNYVDLRTRICPTRLEISSDKLEKRVRVVLTRVPVPVLNLNLSI